jgi:hypothetical protein
LGPNLAADILSHHWCDFHCDCCIESISV